MTNGMIQGQATAQRQAATLGVKQLRGLGLLMKSLPELRSELIQEISRNPVLEDLDHPLETPMSSVERSRKEAEREAVPDYPEDRFEPVVNHDEEAAERRQAFFDNQVKEETLQEHLLAQLPLSDIPSVDWPAVEVLVGDLDDNGFYRGSIPDVCMAFGKTEDEVRSLLAAIRTFDPAGCGATTARECLLAQLDKLEDSPYLDDVTAIIDRHLEDIAAGRGDQVAKELGLDRRQFAAALAELRSLNARPGGEYPGERDRIEYVNPEIHAYRGDDDGHWYAATDKRSLPDIRISAKALEMLRDPNLDESAKAYVRERIEAAKALREAVEKRQQTVENVAQEIFDRQQEFFARGFAALKPLTEVEIAAAVGVDKATVSRTVNGKYASTPFGTVELRRFFILAVKTKSGGEFAQDDAKRKLAELIAAEDPKKPLSDAKLVELMKAASFPVARRTVAKYREALGIACAAERAR